MILAVAIILGAVALLMFALAGVIAWSERKGPDFEDQDRERVGYYRTSQGRKMMPPRNPMISHRKRRGW